jgi:hypothetical protein
MNKIIHSYYGISWLSTERCFFNKNILRCKSEIRIFHFCFIVINLTLTGYLYQKLVPGFVPQLLPYIADCRLY